MAALVAVGAFALRGAGIPGPMWVFAFLDLVAFAVYFWRRSDIPTYPLAWLGYACLALILGTVFSVADMLLLAPPHRGVSMVEAVKRSGWVLLDVVVSMGAAIVALGGAVFALIRARLGAT